MKKFYVFGIFGIILCVVWLLFQNQFNPKKISVPSRFMVPDNELKLIQGKAENGDCEAAYRMGLHYTYYLFQVDKAIKWLRLAAHCPNIEAKEHLIALLLNSENQPNSATEIDNLILEIKKINPKEALKSEEAVREKRQLP